jgi:DnaJ-domain-containing protein 1
MSGTEILVIFFGLFIGYWVVSKFLMDKSIKPENPAPEQKSEHGTTKENDSESLAWHEVLKISPNATVEDIRAAYKILIHQYHPDKVEKLGVELKTLAARRSSEITRAYRQAIQLRGGSD